MEKNSLSSALLDNLIYLVVGDKAYTKEELLEYLKIHEKDKVLI